MIITCDKCGEKVEIDGETYCPKCGNQLSFVSDNVEPLMDLEYLKKLSKKFKRRAKIKKLTKIFASFLCILALCGGIFYYFSANKLSETEKIFYNNYRILEYATKDDYTITVTPGQDGIVFTAKYKDTNETNTYYLLPTTITKKSGDTLNEIIVFLDDKYVGFYDNLINFESTDNVETKDDEVGFMLDYEMYQLSLDDEEESDESEYSFTYKDDISLEKVAKKLK